MVLVDTSVWISFLRNGEPTLQKLLQESQVVSHPFIIGELACGNIHNREEIFSLMKSLPKLDVVEQEELLLFIEKNKMMGIGLGFVDVNLMASAILANIPIYTYDKKLHNTCFRLGIDFSTYYGNN